MNTIFSTLIYEMVFPNPSNKSKNLSAGSPLFTIFVFSLAPMSIRHMVSTQ